MRLELSHRPRLDFTTTFRLAKGSARFGARILASGDFQGRRRRAARHAGAAGHRDFQVHLPDGRIGVVSVPVSSRRDRTWGKQAKRTRSPSAFA